jgi:hypothetical protein
MAAKIGVKIKKFHVLKEGGLKASPGTWRLFIEA